MGKSVIDEEAVSSLSPVDRVTSEVCPFLRDNVTLYSIKGAGEATGRAVSTINMYLRNGMHSVRIGSARLIPEEALVGWIQHRVKSPGRPPLPQRK